MDGFQVVPALKDGGLLLYRNKDHYIFSFLYSYKGLLLINNINNVNHHHNNNHHNNIVYV